MSKWGDRVKKIEQLAQSFQLHPLTTRYKPRLWPCEPSSVWKLFPRQRMAISFAQSCKEVHSHDMTSDVLCRLYILFVNRKLLTFVLWIFIGRSCFCT